MKRLMIPAIFFCVPIIMSCASLQNREVAAGHENQETQRPPADKEPQCNLPEVRFTASGQEKVLKAGSYKLVLDHSFTVATKPPCFVAGTHISTPDGLVAIESIKVGDRVLSYDFEAKQIVEAVVSRFYSRTAPVISLAFNDGGALSVTENHPFYVIGSKWIEAGKLSTRDRVLRITPQGLEATRVAARKSIDGEVQVYNIDVEPHHNYFAEEILVHNY